MRILITCLLCILQVAGSEKFLSFSKAELCEAEPHLSMCQRRPAAHAARSFHSEERDEPRSKSEKSEGFLPEDPFAEIVTRAPPSSEPDLVQRKHFRSLKEYNEYREQEYNQYRKHAQNGALYRIYPNMHEKDSSYCSDLRGMFMFTCQPSKPLRIDLVEFCKDYSAFCNVPNFHRLPGPRMGPPSGENGVGHVGVSGKFGFGVGAVPGLDVGVGWGVDVGPLPGMGESVGVGLGLDLGIMGSKSPEAYRRGQDNPNVKGGGIVGLSGGVGVKAPGAGNIGIGSGIGVGK